MSLKMLPPVSMSMGLALVIVLLVGVGLWLWWPAAPLRRTAGPGVRAGRWPQVRQPAFWLAHVVLAMPAEGSSAAPRESVAPASYSA